MLGDHDETRRKLVFTSRILGAQFKCETCGKIFISLGHLNRHRERRHPSSVVHEDKSIQVQEESNEIVYNNAQLLEASKRIENALNRLEKTEATTISRAQSGEPFNPSEVNFHDESLDNVETDRVPRTFGRNFKTNFTLCDSKLSTVCRRSDEHGEDSGLRPTEQIRKAHSVIEEKNKFKDFGSQTSQEDFGPLKFDAYTSLLDLFDPNRFSKILTKQNFFWCVEASSLNIRQEASTNTMRSEADSSRKHSCGYALSNRVPKLGVFQSANIAIMPDPEVIDHRRKEWSKGSGHDKFLPCLKHFTGKTPLYHAVKNKVTTTHYHQIPRNHSHVEVAEGSDDSSLVSSLPHDVNDELTDHSNESLSPEKAVEDLLSELEVWKSSESYTVTKKKFKKKVRFNLAANLHDVGVDSRKKLLNDVSAAEAHALIQNKRQLMFQTDKHYESLMKKITEEIDRLAKNETGARYYGFH